MFNVDERNVIQFHWSEWRSLPCSGALGQRLVMKRRADVGVLSRPLLSCGRTSPLINNNASSGRRPSNDPDDNETISQRAKQLIWRLTPNPAGNGPVSTCLIIWGRRSPCQRWVKGHGRATQRRSQGLLGMQRLPQGLVSREDTGAGSHSGSEAFHDFYVTFRCQAGPCFSSHLFSVSFPWGERSLWPQISCEGVKIVSGQAAQTKDVTVDKNRVSKIFVTHWLKPKPQCLSILVEWDAV